MSGRPLRLFAPITQVERLPGRRLMVSAEVAIDGATAPKAALAATPLREMAGVKAARISGKRGGR